MGKFLLRIQSAECSECWMGTAGFRRQDKDASPLKRRGTARATAITLCVLYALFEKQANHDGCG